MVGAMMGERERGRKKKRRRSRGVCRVTIISIPALYSVSSQDKWEPTSGRKWISWKHTSLSLCHPSPLSLFFSLTHPYPPFQKEKDPCSCTSSYCQDLPKHTNTCSIINKWGCFGHPFLRLFQRPVLRGWEHYSLSLCPGRLMWGVIKSGCLLTLFIYEF